MTSRQRPLLGYVGIAKVGSEFLHVQIVGESDAGRLIVEEVDTMARHLITRTAFVEAVAIQPEPLSDNVREAALTLSQALERAKGMCGEDRLLSQEDYQILHDELEEIDHYPFAAALLEHGVHVRTAASDLLTNEFEEGDPLGKGEDVSVGLGPEGQGQGAGEDPDDPGFLPWEPWLGEGISDENAHSEHDYPWPRQIEGQEEPLDIWSVTTEEAQEIGDRLGVDWDRFDPEQFRKGIEVEYEHTSDPGEAARIALDHLHELPDYYSRLEMVEEEPEADELLGMQAYRDERGYERNTDGQRKHQEVMEEKLNRPLKSSEDVHHVDGDKGNNAPSNLKVVDHADHAADHGKKGQAQPQERPVRGPALQDKTVVVRRMPVLEVAEKGVSRYLGVDDEGYEVYELEDYPGRQFRHDPQAGELSSNSPSALRYEVVEVKAAEEKEAEYGWSGSELVTERWSRKAQADTFRSQYGKPVDVFPTEDLQRFLKKLRKEKKPTPQSQELIPYLEETLRGRGVQARMLHAMRMADLRKQAQNDDFWGPDRSWEAEISSPELRDYPAISIEEGGNSNWVSQIRREKEEQFPKEGQEVTPQESGGDWWSDATYQEQLDYIEEHPKTEKKPTQGKDPREKGEKSPSAPSAKERVELSPDVQELARGLAGEGGKSTLVRQVRRDLSHWIGDSDSVVAKQMKATVISGHPPDLYKRLKAAKEMFLATAKLSGITHVRVHRGIKGTQAKQIKELMRSGQPIKVSLNSLTSFSTSLREANGFAGGGPREKGVVISMDLPIEGVFAHYAAGFGELYDEREVIASVPSGYVVLGKDQVRDFNPGEVEEVQDPSAAKLKSAFSELAHQKEEPVRSEEDYAAAYEEAFNQLPAESQPKVNRLIGDIDDSELWDFEKSDWDWGEGSEIDESLRGLASASADEKDAVYKFFVHQLHRKDLPKEETDRARIITRLIEERSAGPSEADAALSGLEKSLDMPEDWSEADVSTSKKLIQQIIALPVEQHQELLDKYRDLAYREQDDANLNERFEILEYAMDKREKNTQQAAKRTVAQSMQDLIKSPRKRPKSDLEKKGPPAPKLEKPKLENPIDPIEPIKPIAEDIKTPSGRDRGLNPSVHEEIGEAYQSENFWEDPDMHLGQAADSPAVRDPYGSDISFDGEESMYDDLGSDVRIQPHAQLKMEDIGIAGDLHEPEGVGDGVPDDAGEDTGIEEPKSFGVMVSMRNLAQGVENRIMDEEIFTNPTEDMDDRGIPRPPEEEDLRYSVRLKDLP